MHSLAVGVSESGKTTLMKLFCEGFKKRGYGTAVLDVMNDPGWRCDYRTTDPTDFVRYVKRHTELFFFVDEGGEVLDHWDKQMWWLATQSRHLGHSAFFGGQRLVQIPPSMRSQCRRAYIFNVTLPEAKELAIEYNKPEIVEVADYPQFQFMEVSRFAGVKRLKIIDYSRVVEAAPPARTTKIAPRLGEPPMIESGPDTPLQGSDGSPRGEPDRKRSLKKG